MAIPITSIQKNVLSEEQAKQQKMDELQSKLAEHEEALNQILTIIGELNKIGILEAANSMLQAKEQIAEIALNQVTREPITNMINNVMGGASALTNLDPELTKTLVNGITNGMNEGNDYLQNPTKMNVFDIVKALKDPDFNRAVGFGMHFMKGLGRTLNKK